MNNIISIDMIHILGCLGRGVMAGLKYPERVEGHFVYDDVHAFLEKL